MRARLTLGILLLWCGAAAAQSVVISGARVAETGRDGTVVEFAFSEDVRTTAHDVSATRVEIRLRATGMSAQFDQSDASFDGELDAVARVVLEGSGAGGYRFAVYLAWPMDVELLPQDDARHVALRLTPVVDASRAAPRAPVAAAAPDAALAIAAPAPTGDPGGVEPTGIEPHQQALIEGRQAAMTQEYHRAILLFTKAAESDEVTVRQEALEMLAMARERNHQDAHAKRIYEQYLAAYPDSDAAPRVRQRLAGLITRSLPVQKKLKEPERGGSAWDMTGGLSQFYQRNAVAVNGDSAVVGVDALFSDADVMLNRRTESTDFGLRISASQLYDLSGEDQIEYQISTAYLEGELIEQGVNVRVGRQTPRGAGVLGRYDGAQIQYTLQPWLMLGALGGYAVDYSDNGYSTARPLYGVNAEISLAGGRWEFAPFYMEQRADGLLDRRAVGLETRYFTDSASIFSLVDYDTYHHALNTTYLMANLRVGNGWSAYANVDHRRSPYITTENALMGQGMNNLADLQSAYTDNQIQQLADDRTAELTMASTGFDKRISSRLEMGADISYSDYSSTPASGEVTATPSRQDYYYSVRFRADEIFGSQTYSALFLRYGVGPDSDVSSVYWNNRFTFANVWQFYPRLRVDYRDFTDLGQTQWTVAPSLRLDYRPRRGMYFELEAGYDRTQRDMTVQDFTMTGYYFRFGYRSLF